MSEQINQAKAQLEKLKELEEKATPIIQAIQQNIDESAKEISVQNAEYQKQKQELEIEKKLEFKSLVEKYPELRQLEEKYQKENAEMESKNMEENANFAKEMANLKEQLKDKINWKQVDLVMGKDLVVYPIINPSDNRNRWDSAKITDNISICISADGYGLGATSNSIIDQSVCDAKKGSVSAEKGFIISVDFSSPVPVIFYFEVTTIMSSSYQNIFVGLSSENIPVDSFVGELPNSYAIQGDFDFYWLSGNDHPFECPNAANKPTEQNDRADVIGCGLLQSPEKGLAIFFTANGLLMGKPIPIDSTADLLYPTVSMLEHWLEANFGDDLAKPFIYDIKKCPGMVFE